MQIKIFYSWQSDLPSKTNRYFIEEALKKAVKALREDDSISVEPVLDRDTQGVSGSPDIGSTILEKIAESDIFVGDLSIINRGAIMPDGSDARITPNPNVIGELFFALREMSWERVILVFNTAYGRVEDLPFDLRQKRATTYQLQKDTEPAIQRNELSKTFENALRLVIGKIEQEKQLPVAATLFQIAEEAASKHTFDAPSKVEDYFKWLVQELDSRESKLVPGQQISLVPYVKANLDNTIDLVVEFTGLVEGIARVKNADAFLSLYKSFEHILSKYHAPRGVGGVEEWQFDYYRFLGHELFVILFSVLMKYGLWDVITGLLAEEIWSENNYFSSASLVPYTCMSATPEGIYNASRSSNRLSLHADWLAERHSKSLLSKLCPLKQFVSADLFLYFRNFLNPKDSENYESWGAWSGIRVREEPRFLVEARKRRVAEKLLSPLKLNSTDELHEKLNARNALDGLQYERICRVILEESLKKIATE